MEPIHNEVFKIVENIVGKAAIKEYEAYSIWPQIAGEKIASVCSAETIASGILYVKVKNSVWRQELSLLKPEILEKFRLHFGENVVRDVKFR